MATHVLISRILSLIFSMGIVVLDFWYYKNKSNHPTRWVKLAYATTGLLWMSYNITVLLFPIESQFVMSTTAAPLIAFTLGSILSGSILRFGELYTELKLLDKLNNIRKENTINSIREKEEEHVS